MKRSAIEAGACAALAALCLALATGCERSSFDRREGRDRYLRRALAAKKAENVGEAIRMCEKALDRRPQLARAHRELALMLDHYEQDYVAAIYHYRRYLELRPDSEHRADVEEMMEQCGLAYAATLAASSGPRKRSLQARGAAAPAPARDLAAKRELSRGEGTPGPSPAPSAAAPAVPAGQVHVVQPGETLGTIASRYYGTPSKWTILFDANRDRIAGANNVRVGTRLEIPPP
ncbi:MAG: LysM peptidoglycan-binding domain-containing protein [Kiritimatiellia bacterium]